MRLVRRMNELNKIIFLKKRDKLYQKYEYIVEDIVPFLPNFKTSL